MSASARALCAALCACAAVLAVQGGARVRTRFSCSGRAQGYYADIDTGCQVYHMCDGLGRQFSYSCPNTTLFQQRMLICDHWYMVNCSSAEGDYSANLLIGQRDKPFVTQEDMRLRTPRPDILSVPLNNKYYDGLKEAESKFAVHPGNSIVGIGDSLSGDNSGLDSAKQNYRPPTSWSTGTGVHKPNAGQDSANQHSGNFNSRPYTNNGEGTNTGSNGANGNFNHNSPDTNQGHFGPNNGANGNFNTSPRSNTNFNNGPNVDLNENLHGAASQGPRPTFQPTPQESQDFTKNTATPSVTPPSKELSPPFAPSTTEASEEFDIDVRMKVPEEDAVFKFIKRFDPNSPDSIKTSMTKTEILNINQQLPAGQSSSEDERTPRRNKNSNNNPNRVRDNSKGITQSSRFDSVNIKTPSTDPTLTSDVATNSNITVPDIHLLPPKSSLNTDPSSTVGPPIYYEWKWAVPAFDLQPPKLSNSSNNVTATVDTTGRSPFRDVTRPTPADLEPTPPNTNTEYNISSYFVPDYIFPLDRGHPGYEGEAAETSFKVRAAQPGRASYGENPACPHCHPAYLRPGECEPCVVKR